MSDPTFSQYSYRFRDDTYGESTDNGWLATVDTSYSGVSLDTTYRVRFVIWETNSKNGVNTRWRLEFRHVEGDNAWEPCTTTADAVRPAASTNLTEDGDATNLSAAMNNPGTGTYITTNLGIDDTDGTTGNLTSFTKNDFHHVEFAFQIRSAVVSGGDQVDFRIVETDGDYTVTSYPGTHANLVVDSTQTVSAPVVTANALVVAASISVGPVSIQAPIVTANASVVTASIAAGPVAIQAPVVTANALVVTADLTQTAAAQEIDAPIVTGVASVVTPSLSVGPVAVTAPVVEANASVITASIAAGPVAVDAPVVTANASVVTASIAAGPVSVQAPVIEANASIVTPDLVISPLWYTMDEGTGDTIDAEYHSATGAGVGTEKWVSGRRGGSAIHVSTASDGHYEIASTLDPAIRPRFAITVAVWVQIKAAPGSIATIAGIKYDAGQHSYGFFHPGTSAGFAFQLKTTTGSSNTGNTPAADFDKWYFATYRWETGSGGSIWVFNDDGTTFSKFGSASASGEIDYHASDFPLVVGGNGITANKVNDYLDDLRIYNRYLSDAELKALIDLYMDPPIVTANALVVEASITQAQSIQAPIVTAEALVVTPSLSVGPVAVQAPVVTANASVVTASISAGPVAVQAPVVTANASVVTASISLDGAPQSVDAPVVTANASVVTASISVGAVAITAPVVLVQAEVVEASISAPGAPQSITAPVVLAQAEVVEASISAGPVAIDAPVISATAGVVTPSLTVGAVAVVGPLVTAVAEVITPTITVGPVAVQAPVVTANALVVEASIALGALAQSVQAPIVTTQAEAGQASLLLSTDIVYVEFTVLDQSLTDFIALPEPADFTALDECEAAFEALEEDE